MAEARRVLPPPGPPMISRLAPLSRSVARADRQDVGLGDHRHHVEVEAVEGLPGQELRLGEIAREAAAVAFGNLVLGQCGEEARRGPALLVRPLGHGGPILLDRG